MMVNKDKDGKNRFSTHARGEAGEDIAARHLEKQGFEIIERNWRLREGELDIIAKKGNLIAFVEVKTAYSNRFGDPVEWVNPAKCRQIGKIAGAWIDKNSPENCFFRFDVIALTKIEGGFSIRHIADAFSL